MTRTPIASGLANPDVLRSEKTHTMTQVWERIRLVPDGAVGNFLRALAYPIDPKERIYALVSVALLDLVGYLLDYCQHRIPVLWEFHKVHHSARVMHPLTFGLGEEEDEEFTSWLRLYWVPFRGAARALQKRRNDWM